MRMERVLFPLVTSLLFSGSYIAGKYTTVDLDPLTTTLLRYGVALLFLSCLLPRYGIASLKLARRDIWATVALALSGIVGYHYFFFLSLHFTAVANTAIINATSPVLTGLAAAFFIKERLSLKGYAGVALSFIGVVFLLTRGDLRVLVEHELNRGDLLMLLAVLSFAVYSLIIKTLIGRYSGYTLTFYATLFGVVALLVIAPAENPLDQMRSMSAASFYSILYMGVLGSGLGYLTYSLSIEAIGATRTAGFVYGVLPVFVALLALAFFSQPITFAMLISATIILLGLRIMMTSAV